MSWKCFNLFNTGSWSMASGHGEYGGMYSYVEWRTIKLYWHILAQWNVSQSCRIGYVTQLSTWCHCKTRGQVSTILQSILSRMDQLNFSLLLLLHLIIDNNNVLVPLVIINEWSEILINEPPSLQCKSHTKYKKSWAGLSEAVADELLETVNIRVHLRLYLLLCKSASKQAHGLSRRTFTLPVLDPPPRTGEDVFCPIRPQVDGHTFR